MSLPKPVRGPSQSRALPPGKVGVVSCAIVPLTTGLVLRAAFFTQEGTREDDSHVTSSGPSSWSLWGYQAQECGSGEARVGTVLLLGSSSLR